MKAPSIPIDPSQATSHLLNLIAEKLMDDAALGKIDRRGLAELGFSFRQASPFASGPHEQGYQFDRPFIDHLLIGWLLECGDEKEPTWLLVSANSILRLEDCHFVTERVRNGCPWASPADGHRAKVFKLFSIDGFDAEIEPASGGPREGFPRGRICEPNQEWAKHHAQEIRP